MARYRRRPIIVEAVQWQQLGDHPLVKAYKLPSEMDPALHVFVNCLGTVDTESGMSVVFPGDWIILGPTGIETKRRKHFDAEFEPLDPRKEEETKQ